jgi:multidrug efflux pump subunit AcrA (membrane-fusion protein)
VECDPALVPLGTDFGWCKEHGVHQCPFCHPEIAQVKQPPDVTLEDLERASRALSARERIENASACALYRRRIQFASVDAVRRAGIDVELVERRPMVETIVTNGEITYDQTRVAHLASRLPGTVWRVYRNVGQHVREGDVLALVDAAGVGQAKSELLDALAQAEFQQHTVERLAPLVERQIIPGSRLLEAQTELEQAEIRLRRAQQALANLGLSVTVEDLKRLGPTDRADQVRFLGIPPEIRESLLGPSTSANLIPLVAPLDALVIDNHVVAGEVVDSTKVLFELADTSKMWLTLNVSLEDAAYLTAGQPVHFQPDGSRDEITGSLAWISTDVDRQTRTVTVRADLTNSDGRLRNETFGAGRIVLRSEEHAIVVPSDAVHWDGTCSVVFVRDKNYFDPGSPKLFHTRTVRPGMRRDGYTEIIAGLLPGETVATKGSSVLRSQILKNKLGAGCCVVSKEG